jgi:hypothetical protein
MYQLYPQNAWSKTVRLTKNQLTWRYRILTWYRWSWVAAYRFRFVLPFDRHQIKSINRNLSKENSGLQFKVIINMQYLLYKIGTWIVVSRSGKCVWYATKVTVPGSRGTGTRETIHLPRSNVYCAPSTSFSFDLMLSVWRGPCIDSSISPSLSKTSNIMFSNKVPAWQLCGTCQITTKVRFHPFEQNQVNKITITTFTASKFLIEIWNVVAKISFSWWKIFKQAAHTCT